MGYFWYRLRMFFLKFRRDYIRVGDYYLDCNDHPVLCTESTFEDVAGISMFDGSQPRSCSRKHCNPIKLSEGEVFSLCELYKEEQS